MNQRWSPARYARTADYLFPASRAAVEAVDLRSGEVLLDSATGTGNAAAVALDRGARAIGVDSAPEQIDGARERLPGVAFVVADAEDLPVPTSSVDAAVSVFGIIFADNPIRALDELIRCVRPGGSVAFTTLSADGWPNRARTLLAAELGAPAPSFPTLWSSDDAAERAAADAGLESIEVRSRELRLPLDAGRGFAEQVTERLSALAALRAQLEARGDWVRASTRLDEYLAACAHVESSTPVLVDPYLVVSGRKP
ncbi:class I SAM-dependent methyltransferase [Nocardia mangyaensis]|uniref:class I SAM-dependent methyltransferase n=1 Tax=Nocardia mangyaensis TaxID=2213200 RepID=UPI002676E441|nr:class I SAM-dependent methyltransferase [Nocardia mangyaensis]MDO3647007.1 class I SAM-dependent methyltransferase [Nocardia mangyaensis]